LLARQNILLGKVPTTPTISSIIAGMQSQEALKILHDMPIEPGKVMHFNGMINEMHASAYTAREDCESHWSYGEITELPARAETTTLKEILGIAQADLGPQAVLELDQEIVLTLECPQCNTVEQVLKPLSKVSFEAAHCPNCDVLRETELSHVVTGEESYINNTLASLGIPPLHIIKAYNAQEYRFYELTGDLDEALHFRSFEESQSHPRVKLRSRIRLGDEVSLPDVRINPVHGRIKLHE
jgi:adenylyltransferase/sulfurtransferase